VVDPAAGAASAAIEKLTVKGPGMDLGGRITAQVASAPRVRFAIKGALLDLGEVLALLPPSEKKEEEGAGLTPELRRQLDALDVAGTVDIDKVQRGGLVATGFKASTALEKGLFVLKDAQADFFGGRVDAAGTRFDASEAQPKWDLKAKLEGVDIGKALQSLSGSAPLAGKITGALDLAGTGVEWGALKKVLTGNGGIALKEGALTTTDLGEKVLGAVAQGLRAAGRGGAAGTVAGLEKGKTTLRDLAAHFAVKDGVLALVRPLAFEAPFGAAKLGGKIGLGGEVLLDGTATVSKEALAQIAPGLPLPPGLEVPLSLGGTLESPTVNVNAQQAVAGLAEGAFKKKGQELQKNLQDRAKQEANKGFGDLLKQLGK
jgi:AsmA protein